MWIIEKQVSKGDYVYGVCKSHPKSSRYGYVLMHRLIAENALGRILKDDEIVHHKNGNKRDNSLENLEVMNSREHNRMHAAESPRKKVELVCHWCGKTFIRFANRLGGRPRHFCSRSCNGSHSKFIQTNNR